MSKKTQTELREGWRKATYLWAIIAIIFIILSLIISFYSGKRFDTIQKLESQLELCEENIPVWTLRLVNCELDLSDSYGNTKIRQNMTIEFESHEKYKEWLNEFESNGNSIGDFLNCEIIK